MPTVNVHAVPVDGAVLVECTACGPVGVSLLPPQVAGMMHLGQHMLGNVTFIPSQR